MNVRTLRLFTLGSFLFALGAVALNKAGDPGYFPIPSAPPGGSETSIVCGAPAIQQNYCYGNSDFQSWLYTTADPLPIALLFSAGTIESDTWDHLNIYDGPDNTYPVLFSHDGNFFTEDLTGVLAISSGQSLYMEMSSDASVSCSSGSMEEWFWTVGCLDCTLPQATFTIDQNCELSFFNIIVDITAMGSDPSIDIINTAGAATVVATSTGQYTVGPFTPGTEVEVTLENELNSLCNVESGLLTNSPCPFISCGPDNYDYCYGDNETYIQVYQGNSTYPLRLQFNSGQIYQFDGDLLTIHDGLSEFDPILYSGTGVNGDLSGIFVTSTNPDHALTLKMVSTAFTSCGSGFLTVPWNYTVACLDCDPPAGSAGAVTTDCDAQTFTVEVTVTDLGTDPELEIGNDVGVAPTIVTAPGTFTVGPFPVGNAVTLTLVNDANAICNVELGTFENSFCPIQIVCGNPAFEDSYCYGNSDFQFWLYETTGSQPIALLFSAGTIESDTWDHLNIYDGPDNTYPVLFSHDGNFFTEDLTGVLAISTGQSIYMEMSSDGSVSCSSGSMLEWVWTVGCLDCTQPQVDFDVVLDCDNEQWYYSSHITNLGSDPTINITNTVNSDVIAVSDTGTYLAGPFDFGVTARVVLETDSNTLCSRQSPFTTNPPCPFVSCAPSQYTYCYPNNADTAMVYQSDNAFPIAMIFNAGQMDTFGDSIYVWDGANYLAPLLFSGFNNGDLTDLLFTSSNPANALTMKIRSNFFTSCQDNFFTPMDWSVSCLDCTNPEATFELVPDCIHNGFQIEVNVSDLGVNSPFLRIANSLNTDTVDNVQTGITMVGPFPVDSVVKLTVLNGQNPLCRRVSQEFTYSSDSCVNVACDATGVEYCYTNADTAWFVYTSGTSDPITINFLYGQLLVNDFIQIYNGLDTSAQLIYMGNQGGQIGGLAVASSNPDNALTLLVISSQAGSCATGQGFPPLNWAVGCGLVGVNEYTVDGFAMFPNPTNGELHIRVAEGISGNVRIEVMDLTGRLVMSDQFNASSGRTERFDLGGLNNGQYAVRLSTPTWSKTERLQVVR